MPKKDTSGDDIALETMKNIVKFNGFIVDELFKAVGLIGKHPNYIREPHLTGAQDLVINAINELKRINIAYNDLLSGMYKKPTKTKS